ncbi:MAG: hypothetical protein HOQ32_14980 [Lysobacter sp.]|nr:hypothetical protein [Lysobacter sp.]
MRLLRMRWLCFSLSLSLLLLHLLLLLLVIPAKAGIQGFIATDLSWSFVLKTLDPRFRGDDASAKPCPQSGHGPMRHLNSAPQYASTCFTSSGGSGT